MKITQAGLYVVIGAIQEVVILYRLSTDAYEVHFFIHTDFIEKLPASTSALESISGSVRSWVDLGRAYSFVRNLGWKNAISVERVED